MDLDQILSNKKMLEFIKNLYNGKIKYRLITDTDESARDKVDLRGFEFKFTENDDVLSLNTSFENADLTGCKFNCEFPGVFFENCNLLKTIFNNCTFKSSTFLDSSIEESIFNDCIFEAQIINNCNMNHSAFNNCKLSDVFEIKKTNLSDTIWRNCNLEDGDIIEDCTLQSSNIYETRFERVKIGGFLDSQNLKNVKFYQTIFSYCIIQNSYMENSVFDACYLEDNELKKNSMKEVVFINNTQVVECQFNNSYMAQLGIINSSIYKCDFRNVNSLEKATFNNVSISYSLFPNVDFTQLSLKTPAKLKYCDFSSANFSDMIITKTNEDDVIDVKNSTFEDAIFNNLNPADVFSNYNPDFTRFNAFNEPEPESEPVYLEEIVNYEEIPDITYLSSLDTFIIEPSDVINKNSPYIGAFNGPYRNYLATYESIVKLLTPNVKHVKLPISEMNNNQWYGISDLGNTTLEEWNNISERKLDKMPNIGYVFKCIDVPIQKQGDAVVYIANPPCMDVHELSRQLDIFKIFDAFNLTGTYDDENNTISENRYVRFAKLLYKLLSIHKSDDAADAWTDVFKDIEKRKIIINHAVFHNEEGIRGHPFFQEPSNNNKFLDLISFIENLPLEIQVVWAQNYMNEFITGYGQTIETFDPTKRGDMGFIATCLNGNFEKILFSFRTAIVNFYETQGPVKETEEEIKQTLINSFTKGSLFQTYYGSLQEIDEVASIEGYKTFIETETTLSDEQKIRFLSMFDDADILAKLTIMIGQVAGKSRNRIKNLINKKTIKKAKNKKTIKKAKNKKTIKKAKHKKTIKKAKHKKTIKRKN